MSFLEDERDQTVFFVHGNRVDGCQVFGRGLNTYRALTRTLDDPTSIRFVVWSWPSTRIFGPRRDVLIKAARTNSDCYYLASLLAHLSSDTELGLFGFSFGARIISGALHMLAGGNLCGLELAADEPLPVLQPRIVLMAAAMHRHWWLPCGFHSQCPAVASAMLVQFNPCDQVLKMYPRIDRRNRPQALGYTGFPWTDQLGENAHKLQQQNVCCLVGREHSLYQYICRPGIMDEARRTLLWQPVP
jgi:hypothetical protein